MNKLHIHILGRFLIAITLVCTLSVSTLRGVSQAGASASSSESQTKENSEGTFQIESQTYDDTDAAWTYTGYWSTDNPRRSYGGQIHISNAVEDQAAISIMGSSFTVFYSTAPNYGKLDVLVDNVKIHTINQGKARTSHQNKWLSPEFGLGIHELKLVHANGKAVNIDAIKVHTANPVASPTPGAVSVAGTSTLNASEDPSPTQNLVPSAMPSPVASPVPTNTLPAASPTLTLHPQATFTPTPTIVVAATSTSSLVSVMTSSPTNTVIPTNTPSLLPAPSSTATSTLLPTVTATVTLSGLREYYLDSMNGNDNADGISPSSAWKSLTKLNSFAFQPGDIINLKRGSFWTGGLIVSKSGTATNPILFRAYGEGEKPIFENPGTNSHAIRINGSYITFENILVRNASYSGFYISQNANQNVIRNSEATNVGIGIAVNGANNLITNNYVHDLKMIVNDVGGSGNDYGAVGIEIFNGPNEISYNRLINCRAPSYDFGYDGGAVEIYLDYGNADNSYFHHNYADNTDGFIEIHSRDLQFSAHNVTIAQNVIVNTKSFLDIGMPGYGGGHELKSVQNIRVDQNTFVDAIPRASSEWVGSVFSFHDVTPTAGQIYIRNNIVYTMNAWWIANTGVSSGGFTHIHNIYYLNSQRSSLGFTLDPTEKRVDPQFVDISHNDFHLRFTSPAINTGANLGYTLDFDSQAMPIGPLPDIGAFEH